ncbi:unnamed protein product [Didymodactylos carnosus]|uniref:Small ribosomal subunit protein uS5c n=1 Tax=Didymodactylos carnosus TaxID=1234261 RepID=A0A8S2CSQ8_9BILA|nr:unnamed protein product [Didymodactylos carnosus]CAF3532486.1 unnamed protein product [Didymodactylos carnosus]
MIEIKPNITANTKTAFDPRAPAAGAPRAGDRPATPTTGPRGPRAGGPKGPGGPGQKRDFQPRDKEFKEKIIGINRVSKTTKGGRTMRFAVLVVIGDGKGRVGFGTGKSAEIPDAIKKALKEARKNLFRVKITKRGSLHHEVTGKHGASRVLMKPARDGTGIVAGGAIRAVMELAGYTNVYTKNQGARSPLNMVRATVHGLNQIRTAEEIAYVRDIDIARVGR